MNTKTLVGGILAGVVLFFAGWIIYGMLLKDFMEANTNTCASLPDEEFSVPTIAVSNLLLGFWLAIMLGWSKAKNALEAMKHTAVFAILVCLSYDLAQCSMSTVFSNYTAVAVDTLAFLVMTCLASGVLGWFMNRDTAAPAAT